MKSFSKFVTILAISTASVASANVDSSYSGPSSGELTNDLNQKIAHERGQMPTETEMVGGVDVQWEITEIKIPYPRCSKSYERISFDIPEFRWGRTKFLGIKLDLPKIYSKRVEIKFDFPRCSKDYEVIKLHLPQFSNARTVVKKRKSSIDNLVAEYQPKIRAAALQEAKAGVMGERNKIVAGFNEDIAEVNRELKKAESQVQKDILIAQRKMLLEMQDAVLRDFDQRLSNIS